MEEEDEEKDDEEDDGQDESAAPVVAVAHLQSTPSGEQNIDRKYCSTLQRSAAQQRTVEQSGEQRGTDKLSRLSFRQNTESYRSSQEK